MKMVLKIKGEAGSKFNVIELESHCLEKYVNVMIDGEHMATFSENGEFEFYGTSRQAKYTGTWK